MEDLKSRHGLALMKICLEDEEERKSRGGAKASDPLQGSGVTHCGSGDQG